MMAQRPPYFLSHTLIFPFKIKSIFILIRHFDNIILYIVTLVVRLISFFVFRCKPYTGEGERADRQCDRDGPDFLLFLTFLSRGGIVRGPVCFWFCCFGGFAIRGIAAQPVQRYAQILASVFSLSMVGVVSPLSQRETA